MKKALAAFALLGTGLLMSPASQAKDLTGWFVNGSVGSAAYHASNSYLDLDTDHGTVAIVNAGYRTQFIGFEAGYTDLGSVDGGSNGYSSRISGDGWTVGINGHFNPTPNWYISARGGAFVWKLRINGSYSGNGQFYRGSGTAESTNWYAGVGTGYDIDRHWSLGTHFDYYRMSKRGLDIGNRLFTVSAEYRWY